jgi:hypothetical protein
MNHVVEYNRGLSRLSEGMLVTLRSTGLVNVQVLAAFHRGAYPYDPAHTAVACEKHDNCMLTRLARSDWQNVDYS